MRRHRLSGSAPATENKAIPTIISFMIYSRPFLKHVTIVCFIIYYSAIDMSHMHIQSRYNKYRKHRYDS